MCVCVYVCVAVCVGVCACAEISVSNALSLCHFSLLSFRSLAPTVPAALIRTTCSCDLSNEFFSAIFTCAIFICTRDGIVQEMFRKRNKITEVLTYRVAGLLHLPLPLFIPNLQYHQS